VPQQPSGPNRARLDLVGLLAGLGLGFALAAGLEWFDLTLSSESDVLTALNVPVVALIPTVVCSAAARRPGLILLPHMTADGSDLSTSNGPSVRGSGFHNGL
jgi:hypothetical protein